MIQYDKKNYSEKYMLYTHTQYSPLFKWGTIILLLYSIGVQLFIQEIPILVNIGFFLLMFFIFRIFWSLTISITSTHISHAFHFGFWKKTYALSEIASFSAQKKPFWTGWGIRWMPDGWLYNVAGNDIIRIVFTNGSIVYVGTDEAQNLCAALAQATQK